MAEPTTNKPEEDEDLEVVAHSETEEEIPCGSFSCTVHVGEE